MDINTGRDARLSEKVWREPSFGSSLWLLNISLLQRKQRTYHSREVVTLEIMALLYLHHHSIPHHQSDHYCYQTTTIAHELLQLLLLFIFSTLVVIRMEIPIIHNIPSSHHRTNKKEQDFCTRARIALVSIYEMWLYFISCGIIYWTFFPA